MESVIAFIQAHAGIMAGVVVAILDLIFALSPSLASNGILHSLYLLVKGKDAPPAA